MTHICVGKLMRIDSDNGLSPGRRQVIIWTNAAILINGPLGTNLSEIVIEMQTFSLKKFVWKCRLRNIGHFVSALIGQTRLVKGPWESIYSVARGLIVGFAKVRSSEIGYYHDRIALKFDRASPWQHFSRIRVTLNSYLGCSRLCNIWRYDVLRLNE